MHPCNDCIIFFYLFTNSQKKPFKNMQISQLAENIQVYTYVYLLEFDTPNYFTISEMKNRFCFESLENALNFCKTFEFEFEIKISKTHVYCYKEKFYDNDYLANEINFIK